jgi:hypothetical protein
MRPEYVQSGFIDNYRLNQPITMNNLSQYGKGPRFGERAGPFSVFGATSSSESLTSFPGSGRYFVRVQQVSAGESGG